MTCHRTVSCFVCGKTCNNCRVCKQCCKILSSYHSLWKHKKNSGKAAEKICQFTTSIKEIQPLISSNDASIESLHEKIIFPEDAGIIQWKELP